MEQARKKEQFEKAFGIYEISRKETERAWNLANTVGLPLDDTTLPFLVSLADQKQAIEAAREGLQKDLGVALQQVDGRFDKVIEAATKETAVHNAKIAAGLGDEIAKAVETAVNEAAETDRQASVARERRATMTAATLCVCGVLAVGGLAYATGYVSGRDNAIITASRFEALAKDPAAGQAVKVLELNGPGVFGSNYCGRGANTYRVVEGIELCSPTVKISGPKWTPTQGLKGLPWRVAATIENWTATSSAWLLLVIGAAGGLMLRKGLRNFGRLGPMRWLLDIE